MKTLCLLLLATLALSSCHSVKKSSAYQKASADSLVHRKKDSTASSDTRITQVQTTDSSKKVEKTDKETQSVTIELDPDKADSTGQLVIDITPVRPEDYGDTTKGKKAPGFIIQVPRNTKSVKVITDKARTVTDAGHLKTVDSTVFVHQDTTATSSQEDINLHTEEESKETRKTKIGLAAGGLCLLIIGGFLFFWWRRRRRKPII